MNMYKALVIPELIEIIFAFLSRKDLYRSYTRVNRQWNTLSMLVIQKKRKNEFISIPHIRDNIIFNFLFNIFRVKKKSFSIFLNHMINSRSFAI